MKTLLPFRKFIFLFFSVTFFLVSSCQKDNTPDDETIENDDPIDPTEVGGRFSNHISCSVIAVPNEVGLHPYYKKYLNCSGIPIIGSDAVPDEAMYLAEETLNFMLNGLSSEKTKLISDGNYIALYPEGSNITELPDPFVATASNAGAYTWAGPGSGQLRALASDVSSLLCNPNTGFGHTLVHEIAHMIHIGAILRLDSSFQAELENSYSNAMSSGKWNNTYARTNTQEYLAEAVTIWYGVNWIGPEGGNGSRNDIGTRAQLQSYDGAIYNLINSKYNNLTNVPGCRIPVISGTTANCPNTVTDIDGNVYEVVNIGPMCWMKENLKTTKYRDGSAITNIVNDSEWQSTTTGAWSNYNNDPNNDEIYGKLYNRYALLNSVSICPEGWHVPTFQELQALVNYAGGDYVSYHLRSTNLWNPPGIPATNSSGFSALPSGLRNAEGWFQEGERRTNLASTYVSVTEAEKFYTKAIFADQEFIFDENLPKNTGAPCRCVKDN